MTKGSWIVQRNDPKIAKWAIGSQYNKVDPRVATAIVFVYGARRIYLKVYQGKSNTLTHSHYDLFAQFGQWPAIPCPLLWFPAIARQQFQLHAKVLCWERWHHCCQSNQCLCCWCTCGWTKCSCTLRDILTLFTNNTNFITSNLPHASTTICTCKYYNLHINYHKKGEVAKLHLNKCYMFCKVMNDMEDCNFPDW